MRPIARRHLRSRWAKRAAALIDRAEDVLAEFYTRCGTLTNDPMTAAMGAPVEDFYEDFRRSARRKLRPIISELRKYLPHTAWEWASV